MSYWIEIHCDAVTRRGTGELARYNDSECHSFGNDNPGVMVRGLNSADMVKWQAKNRKWQNRGLRWFCPSCAAITAGKLGMCANCGHPKSEHSYNGACYGLCGEFVAVTGGELSK